MSKKQYNALFGVLYCDKTWVFDQSEGVPDPIHIIKADKTRPASFLKDFKNIPQKACLLEFGGTRIQIVRGRYRPASRAFSYGTYALYREKALHESCQVLVEHAQGVAK